MNTEELKQRFSEADTLNNDYGRLNLKLEAVAAFLELQPVSSGRPRSAPTHDYSAELAELSTRLNIIEEQIGSLVSMIQAASNSEGTPNG